MKTYEHMPTQLTNARHDLHTYIVEWMKYNDLVEDGSDLLLNVWELENQNHGEEEQYDSLRQISPLHVRAKREMLKHPMAAFGLRAAKPSASDEITDYLDQILSGKESSLTEYLIRTSIDSDVRDVLIAHAPEYVHLVTHDALRYINRKRFPVLVGVDY